MSVGGPSIWVCSAAPAGGRLGLDLPGVISVKWRFARLAGAEGFSVQLHILDVPLEERWRRVQARNEEKGETHQLQFEVTRDMFDFVESMWEPPGEAEKAACNAIVIVGAGRL